MRMHSPNFAKVKRYYLLGLWPLICVRNAVGRWITSDEYTEIIRAKEEQDAKYKK